MKDKKNINMDHKATINVDVMVYNELLDTALAGENLCDILKKLYHSGILLPNSSEKVRDEMVRAISIMENRTQKALAHTRESSSMN